MLFLDFTPDLTPIELDVYKYIANHLDKVVYMRIRELAQETHVSTTTILRFCQKFECSGFSEFKIRLNLYLKESAPVAGGETFDAYAIKHFISRTLEPDFQQIITQAAELLQDKSLLLFIGKGVSSVTASYGALHFSSVCKMALRIEDPENYPFDFLNETDARNMGIIILSVSGETREIIRFLNKMTVKQATIISITNSQNSTIARLSDVNIPYYITKKQIQDADVTSQIPAMYILEQLASSVKKHLNQ